MRGTMPQYIETKFNELSHKRALFNQGLNTFQNNYYNNQIFNQYTLEQQKAIALIIDHLNWIKQLLDSVNTNQNQETSSTRYIDAYLEIAEHGLRFVLQQESNFYRFYQDNPRDRLEIAIQKLGAGFNILLLIEKALLIPTLLFAASPMLMLSLFPSLFGEAMMFISPLLLMLPPLTYTVCAIGALLLVVKMIQVGLRYYSKKDNIRELSDLNNIKHEAADKLLKSAKAMDKIGIIKKEGLFSEGTPEYNTINKEHKLVFTQR